MENFIAVYGNFLIALLGPILGGGALIVQMRSASVVMARTWQKITIDQDKSIRALQAEVAALRPIADEALALRARVAVLETALAAAEAKIAVLQGIADKATELQEKIECLEQELTEVKALGARQAAEIERLTERVQVLEQEKHALEIELVRVTTENGNLMRENGDLKKKVSGF